MINIPLIAGVSFSLVTLIDWVLIHEFTNPSNVLYIPIKYQLIVIFFMFIMALILEIIDLYVKLYNKPLRILIIWKP